MGALIRCDSYQSFQDQYPNITVGDDSECSVCLDSLGNAYHKPRLVGHIAKDVAHLFHEACHPLTKSTDGYANNCALCHRVLVQHSSVMVSFSGLADVREQFPGDETMDCVVCQDSMASGPVEDSDNTKLLGHFSIANEIIIPHLLHERCMVQTLAHDPQCPECRTLFQGFSVSPIQGQLGVGQVLPNNLEPVFFVPDEEPLTWEQLRREICEGLVVYMVGVAPVGIFLAIVAGVSRAITLSFEGAALSVIVEGCLVTMVLVFVIMMITIVALWVLVIGCFLLCKQVEWAAREIVRLI